LIKRLDSGEPIDYPTINAIIDRLNALDSADHLGGIAYDKAKTRYDTTKDKLTVQAFRVNVKTSNKESDYTAHVGKIAFPTAFAAPPIVTVGFNNGGMYLVPYVYDITSAGFGLSVLRASASNADAPTSVNINCIAVGLLTLKK
jgi:hypothetical protein